MHGIRTKSQHRPSSHLDLRSWYERKRKLRVDAQIRGILDLHRLAEPTDMPATRAMLPPVWDHKTEVLIGDTVYVRHDRQVRSFILSVFQKADPKHGKVSITSPIGRALFGRRPGDTVHLRMLDGDCDYTILKIL